MSRPVPLSHAPAAALDMRGCTQFKRGKPSAQEKEAHIEKLSHYLYLSTQTNALFVDRAGDLAKAFEEYQRSSNVLERWSTFDHLEAPEQDLDECLRQFDAELERLSSKGEAMTLAECVAFVHSVYLHADFLVIVSVMQDVEC